MQVNYAECCESKESFIFLGKLKEIKNLIYLFIRLYIPMCTMLLVDEKEIQIFKIDFSKYCFVSIKQGVQGANIFSVTVCNGYTVCLYDKTHFKTEDKNTQPSLSNLATLNSSPPWTQLSKLLMIVMTQNAKSSVDTGTQRTSDLYLSHQTPRQLILSIFPWWLHFQLFAHFIFIDECLRKIYFTKLKEKNFQCQVILQLEGKIRSIQVYIKDILSEVMILDEIIFNTIG